MSDFCIDAIIEDIIANCTTQGIGGNEIKAWFAKRSDVESHTADPTNPSMITSITMKSGKKMWTYTGVKKIINTGHDLVTAPDLADTYTHYVNFKVFDHSASANENADVLEDIIWIAESKDKGIGGDGTFRVSGFINGLSKTTDTKRDNDINGVRNIELASTEGAGEPFSQWTFYATDYATTLVALVALETPAV